MENQKRGRVCDGHVQYRNVKCNTVHCGVHHSAVQCLTVLYVKYCTPCPLSPSSVLQPGVFLHRARNFGISNSTFVDNTKAIHLGGVESVRVARHRIVGVSSNHGNPRYCNRPSGYFCGPISGCT